MQGLTGREEPPPSPVAACVLRRTWRVAEASTDDYARRGGEAGGGGARPGPASVVTAPRPRGQDLTSIHSGPARRPDPSRMLRSQGLTPRLKRRQVSGSIARGGHAH